MAAVTSSLSLPEPPALDVQAIETWYDAYIADSLFDDRPLAAIREVDEDSVEDIDFEDHVKDLVSHAAVEKGYCKICRHELANWPSKADSYAHKPWTTTTMYMAAASRAGCRLCAFFWSCMGPSEIATFRKIERRLQLLGEAVSSRIILAYRKLSITYPGKRFSGPLAPYGGITLCYTNRLSQPLFSQNTELDRFESAVAWLRTCDESHDDCQRRTDLERPRRLVSVHNEAVKVVDTQAMGDMPRYATLSYCWGRDDFIKLTMETMDSFYEGLNYTNLPQTFQDAIFVTRRLGLDYLWIDALCITQHQEDTSDWLSESARMRSIYGGGYVNIAATHTGNVHEGFLHRSDGYVGGISSKVSSSRGSHTRVFYARNSHAEFDGRLYHWKLSDLAKRGWAFQERLLAKRTLHFTKYGVLWECRKSNAYEFAPEPRRRSMDHLACPDHEPWDWIKIVNEYSVTKLTVSSDRLTALAGIARRQSETKPDQYLAGMWRSQLIDQLCWSATVHKHCSKRPDWRAPTWSWASIDGTVVGSWFRLGSEEDELRKKEYVSLLDVWTKPSGPDTFGAISDGKLKLECYTLVQGWLTSRRRSSSSKASAPKMSKLRIILEASIYKFAIYLDHHSDIDTAKKTGVYLLPIRDGAWDGNTNVQLIAGLVLQHIEGSRGRFRRLGAFFFLEKYSRDEPNFDEMDSREVGGDVNVDCSRDSERSNFLFAVTRVGDSTAARVCEKLKTGTIKADHRFIATIE